MNKKTIIIIPFILPWDWSADYQRQTCLELAKTHNVIAYMQKDAIFVFKALIRGKKQYPFHKNITFYQPVYLFPFRRFSFIEEINKRISFLLFQLFQLGLRKYVLWIFDPCFYFMPNMSVSQSLYDCVDYHQGFHNGDKSSQICTMEKLLILRVTFFFVNSNSLYNLHKETRIPDCLVPQGFKIDVFRHPKRSCVQFSKSKPIIGYVGSIDNRLEYTLLEKLITKNSQWHFVFWGPITSELPKAFYATNVTLGESNDVYELPGIIKQFDVGIIPLNCSIPGVLYSFPMKFFEYIYMGIPVLSSPVRELLRFSKNISIASSAGAWRRDITLLLRGSKSSSMRNADRKFASKNSWESKIKKIKSKINSQVEIFP